MNYLIMDKQFLILCKFIIIGSDILFNRLCLFRRVCRLFGGFSARFTDLGANKCMPDRQFIRLHLNLCRQNTFHSYFCIFSFTKVTSPLGSSAVRRVGSSPTTRTKMNTIRVSKFLSKHGWFPIRKAPRYKAFCFFVYSLCISGNIKNAKMFLYASVAI